MSASPYSVAMAMVWFTLASLIGCFILRRAEKWGLALVGMIFLLTALRIFVPLDITGSIIIRSQVVYPALQNGLRYSIAGRISVGDCLLLLWMIGTVVQLLRLARDLSRQRKLRNEAELQEGNEWLDSLFLAIAKEAGYHGHFRLAVAENAASAYQAGFLCPYILLPAEIDTFSDEDISNMLRHELRHFLNGDLWIKTGFQVMRGILWWNPIMPMLNQSIGQLLELRCDQQVCKHLSRSGQMSYMETLIKLMRNGTAGFAEAYMMCQALCPSSFICGIPFDLVRKDIISNLSKKFLECYGVEISAAYASNALADNIAILQQQEMSYVRVDSNVVTDWIKQHRTCCWDIPVYDIVSDDAGQICTAVQDRLC